MDHNMEIGVTPAQVFAQYTHCILPNLYYFIFKQLGEINCEILEKLYERVEVRPRFWESRGRKIDERYIERRK